MGKKVALKSSQKWERDMELKLEAHKRDWGMGQKDQLLSLGL